MKQLFMQAEQRSENKSLNLLINEVTSMEEAVKKAYDILPGGGIVLLSPASPSYDLFKNYEDKSAQYRQWIQKLS